MNLLAVDTSSDACSVALQLASEVFEDHVVEARAHTKILLPMISGLLSAHDARLADLDAIVLGNGPGSFIGMRIGASVVQGLCFGARLPVVPISSLLAVAAQAMHESEDKHVVVAQDARMDEAYVGHYVRGGDGLPELIGAESIVAAGELPITAATYATAGAAWVRYPKMVTANRQYITNQLAITEPRALYLLAVAGQHVSAGETLDADAISPAYLRTKVAEIPSA